MRIHLITVCFNEERILPYFLKHYSFCDLITVFDGNSTDRSVEIIKSFPNTSVIQEEPKGNKVRDSFNMRVKNYFYKIDIDYDWIICVDMDEFLYHPNLLEKLEQFKKDGITIPLTEGYDMYTKVFPTENKQLFELVKMGRLHTNHSKCAIFNPKSVDINYGIGAHSCNPTGQVKYSEERELKILHYIYLSHESMTTKRGVSATRLSDENIKNGWGSHSLPYSLMTEKEYDELEKTMTKVI